ESEGYLREIRKFVARNFRDGEVCLRAEFIPDEEIEVYLKGADVLVLPYREIFQSGILIMAYTFGLPVVATTVGSFGKDVIQGRTGFLCEPGDSTALADAIEQYFTSDLYQNLSLR